MYDFFSHEEARRDMSDEVAIPARRATRESRQAARQSPERRVFVTAAEGRASGIVHRSKNYWSMAEMGHFRPIRRGRAMSVIPSEADIRTACVYEYAL
jgi:hypothetical protein